MIENFYAILLGYFLGALPSAYLIVKLTSGKDLRSEGSGNIGARNSLESTGKKWVGTLVLVLDLLKAVAAVKLSEYFFNGDMFLISMTSVFVLLGHNYNVFLKFKGGRGLASAAGIFLAINPLAVILWLLMYFTGMKIIHKNVHIASVIASLGMPLLIVGAPEFVILETQTLAFNNAVDFKALAVAVCLVIIIKHISPIKAFLDKKEAEEEKNNEINQEN